MYKIQTRGNGYVVSEKNQMESNQCENK